MNLMPCWQEGSNRHTTSSKKAPAAHTGTRANSVEYYELFVNVPVSRLV